MVQVLRYGYRVPFRPRPPLSRVPIPLPSYSPNSIRGLALSASVGSCVFGQLCGLGLPPKAGGHSLVVPECGRSGTSLRVSECSGRFPQLPLSSPWVRMDFVSSGCLGAPASVASHHRSLRNITEPSPAGVFLTNVRPTVCWHRCDVAVLGRTTGLCLPSLQPSSSGVGEGSGFQRPGADVGGSLLASAPLVPGPSGAASRDPPLPATKEGSSQTTTLSSLPPEPVCASADCISYLRRSARQPG